jgi:hypothetical protein
MTFQSYLDGKHWGQPCFTFNRAIRDIQQVASSAISEIMRRPDDPVGDAWIRLRAGVHFLTEMVAQIEKLNPAPKARTLRHRDQRRFTNGDLYDRIAEAMFEIIHSAALVTGPPDEAWSIHHISVWSDFFDDLGKDRIAMKIVQHKVRRLLFDEIKEFEKYLSYKSARILGICLNVMRLKPQKRSGYGRQYAALKSVLLPWVQRNYKKIRARNSEVADTCLIGGITFDEKESRLVKTYAKGLSPEPKRDYLAV